jgi:(p)ppGpp synthase/HD superfamily hydrolase
MDSLPDLAIPPAPARLTAEVLRAAQFAGRVHAAHRRKGAAAEPYVNHVLEVAALLAEHGAPGPAIIAGLLHDVVEDSDKDPVPTTLADVEAAFGPEVAGIVAEVSDDKSLPKETRKALQIRHAPQVSAAAKQVKLADKIANLRAIAESPPAGWEHARRVEYVGWAGRVAAGLRGANPGLDALFDATYRDALARLAAQA